MLNPVRFRPFAALFLVLFIAACQPRVFFLGDAEPATTDVEVYYDEKDVPRAYRTIGQLTHGKYANHSADKIKKYMIAAAREKGGDGIIFEQTTTNGPGEEMPQRLSVLAKVIKFEGR